MNQMDKLRKQLTVNQLMESGKWIPVDALGRRIESKADLEHVELFACADCGKKYKWNQASWMAKHEAEHVQEKQAFDEPSDVAHTHTANEATPTLRQLQEDLWTLMARIDKLVAQEEAQRKRA